jgi:hypothetical protein
MGRTLTAWRLGMEYDGVFELLLQALDMKKNGIKKTA